MPFGEVYRRQVQLLVRTLPLVAQEECFALKGGTAINLFYRNLPRLSVDIDLAYLPLADRAQSLAEIDAAPPWGPASAANSFDPPSSSVGRLLLQALAHGFAFEIDAVGVVDQPVEDSVGEGGITDRLMPLANG